MHGIFHSAGLEEALHGGDFGAHAGAGGADWDEAEVCVGLDMSVGQLFVYFGLFVIRG